MEAITLLAEAITLLAECIIINMPTHPYIHSWYHPIFSCFCCAPLHPFEITDVRFSQI